MNFLVITQGCKVNRYDSDTISQIMISAGFSPVIDGEEPDAIIINSCTVTENSDKKAFRIISKMKREFPSSIIVLTGCYPQAFPKEAELIENADIIVGNAGKREIPQLINDFSIHGRKVLEEKKHDAEYCESEKFFHSSNTRAFIKIEDGCNRYCSYCIIPSARGRVRSRSLENIKSEVEFHAKYGHKEIVLAGINLSCYGTDIGLSLFDAVKAAAENPLIERVRLSSLEPELLTYEEIKKLASVEKLCPHFHLSLQSGCSQTLKRMNRHYSPDEYMTVAENLRNAFPSCAITTDVMVGFADETEDEFNESAEFVKNAAFAKIHVFTYSVRPGTAAASMTQVPENIKGLRYRQMSEIAAKAQNDFFEKNVGTVHKVLIERQTSPHYINGYTENYIPVRIIGGKAQRHDIISVEIKQVCDGFCIGEITF